MEFPGTGNGSGAAGAPADGSAVHGRKTGPLRKNGQAVIGVLLFSRKHNRICCLAVAPEFRRMGIGSALVEKALQKLDRSRDITVTTFREEDEKGTAPRGLYKRFGFAEGILTEEFSYPVQEFRLGGNGV